MNTTSDFPNKEYVYISRLQGVAERQQVNQQVNQQVARQRRHPRYYPVPNRTTEGGGFT